MTLVASPDYIEHDSYMIFQSIMVNTKAWFESNQRMGESEVNVCFPFFLSFLPFLSFHTHPHFVPAPC